MIRYIICLLFFSVLFRFNATSQGFPRSIILEEDTCIVFTLNQSKEIAKWNEQKKENFDLLEICSEQVILMDSIVLFQDSQLKKSGLINLKFKNIIQQKDELMLFAEAEKKSLLQEVKVQKRQKWISISVGSLVATILTIISL